LASLFASRLPLFALKSMITKLLRRLSIWLRSALFPDCPRRMSLSAAAPPTVTGRTTDTAKAIVIIAFCLQKAGYRGKGRRELLFPIPLPALKGAGDPRLDPTAMKPRRFGFDSLSRRGSL
jgi:hypothetical protein